MLRELPIWDALALWTMFKAWPRIDFANSVEALYFSIITTPDLRRFITLSCRENRDDLVDKELRCSL